MPEIENKILQNTGENISAVGAVEALLAYAIKNRSSDIHCDPSEHGLSIRLRIDGKMVPQGMFPLTIYEEMISRLKILSGTRTDLHNTPQDGRWRTKIDGEEFNIRISFMPTYHGENAVMRLLPAKTAREVSFSRLGFSPEHAHLINDAVRKTSGLILVTGPTGSGKTTTIHACLSMKVSEPISIVTLEDPVEYEIPGVRQVHVRHDYGVSFSTGLRAVVRQDPDVIMVGEIRDAETAKVAIHTALTGHLVFSTLHTNSAIEAITRLYDMGVDNYLLASTLKLSIAQRLVRSACRECLTEGCESCKYEGYIGRSVIAEVFEVDKEIEKLISNKAGIDDIFLAAKKKGFRPMPEDGNEKVEWGITTKEEVARVLSE